MTEAIIGVILIVLTYLVGIGMVLWALWNSPLWHVGLAGWVMVMLTASFVKALLTDR